MEFSDLFLVEIKDTLPFELNADELIYVEKEHNEKIDSKISYASKFNDFVYLPSIAKNIMSEEIMAYYNPSCHKLSFNGLYNIILNHIENAERDLIHGFLGYTGIKDNDLSLCFFVNITEDFDVREIGEIQKMFEIKIELFQSYFAREYGWKSSDSGIRYSVAPSGGDGDIPANDEDWDEESKRLMLELMEQVDRLEQKGISRAVIQYMIGADENVVRYDELSDIVIDEKNRILLSGYKNREVKMTPLVKSVYIFFLKHPEGVVQKEMIDHYEELLSIYNHITSFSDNDDIKNAIQRLCTPTDNSMNEKCSRIKQIFISMFDQRLARHYYIQGGRNEKKRIDLSGIKIKILNNKLK